MQYIIDRPDPGQQFIEDRFNAMQYIDRAALIVEDLNEEHKYMRWIKTEPSYPSFDDFTFAYKNQIFSVMVLRVDDKGMIINPPPRLEALRRESGRNNLIPCVFPLNDKTGQPLFMGTWNLVNPFTGKRIYPDKISSDSLVKVSDWELRNWAVNIVWNYLDREGFEKYSYCDAPEINPQIWFKDRDNKECWIQVLYSVEPDDVDKKSFSFDDWPKEVLNHDGYISRVGFVPAENSILYRNQGAFIKFQGIEIIHRA